MKRSLLRVLASASLFLAPQLASADDIWIYCGGLPGCPSGFTERLTGVLTLLLARLPAYIQGFGVLFIMIGGAYILLSAGNEERVTKGKNTITWAVIGIFVTEFADQLVGFVRDEANSVPSGDIIQSVTATLIGSIFDLLYIALVGIALFSGMRMVLAFGKEEEFTKAQNGLFYAALGGIIINLSQQIFDAFATL